MKTDNELASIEVRDQLDNMQEFVTQIERNLKNGMRMSYTTQNMTASFANLVSAIAVYNYTLPMKEK